MELASPNKMIWDYFAFIRDLSNNIADNYNNISKQNIAACIIMSVTAVEIFLNIYFRNLIEEKGFEHCKKETLNEFKRRVSLSYKLDKWPVRFFGKELGDAGLAFGELKKLRNNLVHFESSYTTFETHGVEIMGMVDISSYQGLTPNDAIDAVTVAENFMKEIFSLRGIPEDKIAGHFHGWTGRLPDTNFQ